VLKAENLVPHRRLVVVYSVVIFLTVVLLGRFFLLQIYRYEKYKLKAEVNRIRAVTINAPRGLIVDRYGERLVDNYPTFVITAIPGEIGSKEQLFKKVSSCTGIDSMDLAANYHKYYRGRFVPTRLAKDLSFAQISILEEHKLDLAGLQYEQFPERIYPSPIRGSHFLGYVKEVDRNIRDRLGEKAHYELGDLIGWQGLEKVYEDQLRGHKGISYLEVDALGRIVGRVNGEKEIPPTPGQDLVVTIDATLQGMMEDEMRDHRGVVLVSDPQTGEILAYVSAPDYPPDLFTGATSVEEWDKILTDSDRPLLDRISSGLYPPGSTFKIVTLLALLENRLVDPEWTVECTGSYTLGDRVFRCWKEGGHGTVNLREALIQSCNVYYYQVVQKLSFRQWADLCFKFGFGQTVGIDLPSERAGLIPTPDYMDKKYGRWGWSRGYMLNLAIGQGDIVVTPLQMANFINIVATEGKAKQLHLSKSAIVNNVKAPVLRETTWRRVNDLLKGVVYDQHGTGKAADPRIKGLVVAGKTGTAENPHGDPHAWFVGYGKKGDKLTSVVILIENGGHGGTVAAPIARKIFAYLYGPGKQLAAQVIQ